jgi:hypothetical protein
MAMSRHDAQMSDTQRRDDFDEPVANTDERLAWSSPTLTDLGAVSEVTEGLSYTTGDGLTNLTP